MGFPRHRAVGGLMHGGGTVTGAVDWIEAQDNDDDDDEKSTAEVAELSDAEERRGKGQTSNVADVNACGDVNEKMPSAVDGKKSSPRTKEILSALPEVIPLKLPDEGGEETLGRREKIPPHAASVPEMSSAPRPITAESTVGKAAVPSSGGGNDTATRPETIPTPDPLTMPFVHVSPGAGGTSNSVGRNPELEEEEGTATVFADGPSFPSHAATVHTHEEGVCDARNEAPLNIRGSGESDALSAYVVSERGGGNRSEQRGGNEVAALPNAGVGMDVNSDEGVYDGVAVEDRTSELPRGFLQKHRTAVGAAALCAAAVAVAVPLVVMWRPSNSSQEKGEITNAWGNVIDTPQFTIPSQRFSAIKSFLQAQMDRSLAGDPSALDDEASPQWRALRWLAEEDARQVSLDDELSLTQRFALATVHYAAGGANGYWIRGSHFLSFEHECQWWATCHWLLPDYACDEGEVPTGVLCSGNMTIDGFIMEDNNITGTLPAEVGLLSSLQALLLSGNAINGTIPSSLSTLQKLLFLYLDSNFLTGPIPSSLGNLSELQALSLDQNLLSGIIPSSLGNLRELQYLKLDQNSLSGMIPSSLGSLTELQHLTLHLNDLSGPISTQLGQLSNLKVLVVLSNSVTGSIPIQLNGLNNLTLLYLDSNLLSGTLPFKNGSLPKIEFFSARENNLTGGTDPLCSLKTLALVNLNVNSFTGTVPGCLGTLSRLGYLRLNWNKIVGKLPSALSQLSELRHLDLAGNRLSGAVPAGLGNLTELEWLSLNVNQLTGLIPTSLVNLRRLEVLGLAYNNFTGDLDFVCNMSPTLHVIADCHAASPHEVPEVTCSCCDGCCHNELHGPDFLGCFPP